MPRAEDKSVNNQCDEDSESEKSLKKELHEQLFTEDLTNNLDIKSPVKKRIKLEPESDVEITKKNDNHENETQMYVDEHYLKLQVKEEITSTTSNSKEEEEETKYIIKDMFSAEETIVEERQHKKLKTEPFIEASADEDETDCKSNQNITKLSELLKFEDDTIFRADVKNSETGHRHSDTDSFNSEINKNNDKTTTALNIKTMPRAEDKSVNNQCDEDSESEKSLKKELHEQLFTEDLTNNLDIKSPVKKRIKLEPESDVEITKKNDNHENETQMYVDEHYLKLQVKEEITSTTSNSKEEEEETKYIIKDMFSAEETIVEERQHKKLKTEPFIEASADEDETDCKSNQKITKLSERLKFEDDTIFRADVKNSETGHRHSDTDSFNSEINKNNDKTTTALNIKTMPSEMRRPSTRGGLRGRRVRVRGGRGYVSPAGPHLVSEVVDVVVADRGGTSGRGRTRGGRTNARHERPGPSYIDESTTLATTTTPSRPSPSTSTSQIISTTLAATATPSRPSPSTSTSQIISTTLAATATPSRPSPSTSTSQIISTTLAATATPSRPSPSTSTSQIISTTLAATATPSRPSPSTSTSQIISTTLAATATPSRPSPSTSTSQIISTTLAATATPSRPSPSTSTSQIISTTLAATTTPSTSSPSPSPTTFTLPPPSPSTSLAVPSPSTFIECESNAYILPPPPCPQDLRDEDIVSILNNGSDYDSDDDGDSDVVGTTVPRVLRSLFETPLDFDDTARQATRPDTPPPPPSPLPPPPSSGVDPIEVPITATEQPWSLYDFNWGSFPNPQIPPGSRRETFCQSNVGPTTPLTDPYDIFIAIWDRQIMEHIASETNRYAQQVASQLLLDHNLHPTSRISRWHDTTADELYVYFAILMAMGIVVKSKMEEYWGSTPDIFYTPGFSAYMSVNRFAILNRCLHFVNNDDMCALELGSSEARLFKIRPILLHLNKKFQEMYNLGQNISLDESLLTRNGWLNTSQLIPNKAANRGIKTYELCESQTGYLWRFEVHVNKPRVPPSVLSDPLQASTPSIVVNLTKGLEYKGHTLWMDNYYQSPCLARHLKSKGFDCVGTLRTNRRYVPQAMHSRTRNNMRMGQVTGLTSGDIDVLVWRDTNRVATISTYHGNGLQTVRGSTKPIVIYDYNIMMGGVDKKDQLLALFPTESKRTKVWYKKLFRRLLNVSILNSFIIHHRTSTLSHRLFRINLIKSILSKHSPSSVLPVRVTHYSADQVHRLAEYPMRNRQRMRRACAVCKKQVRTFCVVCSKTVCMDSCFLTLHSP